MIFMADFIEVNADLHLHGLYSGAVSENMIPRTIGEQAPLKGLDMVGTADILNERWIKLVKEQLKPINDSVFEHENGTKFILQTEVEDSRRIHHIVFFPCLSKVYEVREKLKSKCRDLDSDGRPKIWMGAEELAELCTESECMIGPSHAFTPWTAIFKEYNSVKDCYGSQHREIHFLELGLSADTEMADRISELHRLTFLSNSDAHSPWPNKMGREFTRFLLRDLSFEELEKGLKRKGGRKPILNVGFNPKEGKYHKTRCIGCLLFFRPRDAERFGWKCPNCGKTIKKGVDARIEELADTDKQPKHRPPYIHIIPLSEIIAIAIDTKQVYSNKVQTLWNAYVKEFGNEIQVLTKTPIEDLKRIHARTGELIELFRENKFRYIPGGGGVYGVPVPPGKKFELKYFKHRQKTLADF